MSNNTATVDPDVKLVNQDSDEPSTQALSPSDETTQKNDRSSTQKLSLSDAATQLGISVGTCRRWIKKGRIAAERVPITTGFVYRIDADVVAAHENLPSDTSQLTTQGNQRSGTQVNHDPTTRSSQNGHASTHKNGHAPSPVTLVATPPEMVTQESVKDDDENGTVVQAALEVFENQVRRLHEENTQLSGQVGFLQAQLQAADKEIKRLQAPHPEVVEPEPPRRRRWYWLWMRAT